MSAPRSSQRRFLPRSAASAAAFLLLAASARAQTLLRSDSSLLAIDDVAITPDQRYAVVRQNRFDQFARVYDLATGALVASPPADFNDDVLGACLDAVAVTNSRAVVLGNRVQILDLGNLANPLLASNYAGHWPRDVVITPDGALACVRGGTTEGTFVGGQYLFDLATGAQVGFHPGEPTPYGSGGNFSFDVDSVAATNAHAVMCSFLDHGSGTPETRVTIWELHPGGGGPPAVAFETGTMPGAGDQLGAPYDVAITPDGTKAFVRSEFEVGAYDLSVSPPALLWNRRPAGNPGPFYEEALDAIEVTNDRVFTISKISNPNLGTGAQVDVYEMDGTDHHSRVDGSPHDLAITPDGTRGLVRTNVAVYLYDLAHLPAGPDLPVLAQAAAPSSTIQYFAGLDSVSVTDRFAVTLSRQLSPQDILVHFWDISGPGLVEIATRDIPHQFPIDVAITPDGTKVAVSGDSNLSLFDLATGALLFSNDPCPPNAYFPWCNGVAASDDKVVGVCQWGPQSGWIVIADTSPLGAGYCVGAPNSAGAGARIDAGGTRSVAANDLKLFVRDAPANVTAFFDYGARTVQLPFGNGFECVGGTRFALPTFRTNEAGAGWTAVDYGGLPVGGTIAAGSTWNFQCVYRDRLAGGGFSNASDAITIQFVP